MVVAIHQPHYIPWLGYFYKIAKSDVFVFLDNVQYSKNSYINRNKIKSPQGVVWLTVPVKTKNRFGQPINAVEIDNRTNWAKKHLKALILYYKRAKFFEKYEPFLEKIYTQKWEKLIDINITLITYICEQLRINTKFEFASNLQVGGKKMDLVINICKALGADTYLSGLGGKKYQDEEAFKKAGITLIYSQFVHPVYPQLWGNFIPNLSILDLLFNCGDKSLDVLLGS